MNQEELERKWNELGISDNFIFTKVMQNEEICKEFLEMVLDIEIEYIEYPVIEKTINTTHDGKGVRLDVHVADDKRTVYNVEMQATDTKELPARSRYYQGVIDLELLERGENYKKLNTSYIIFICRFDLFKRGRYRYTFEQRCIEEPDLRLGDGTTRIFLNTKGIIENNDISEKLQAFLIYVEGQSSDNGFVKKLANKILEIKENKKWRVDYMNDVVRMQLALDEGIEIGMERGIERGIEQGMEESLEYNVKIVNFLSKNNRSDEIAEVFGDKEKYMQVLEEMDVLKL